MLRPICLPDQKYKEYDKVGYVMGYGNVFQKSCHTNSMGPEFYTPCAPGFIMDGMKTKTWSENEFGAKTFLPGCQSGQTPAAEDPACLAFNYLMKEHVSVTVQGRTNIILLFF